MATTDADEAVAPAEGIPDFGAVYPRHLGGHTYAVLSLTDAEPTAYEVNVQDLSCSCPDEEFNREEPEVCKHLAAALYKAPDRLSMEVQAFDSYLELFAEARDATAELVELKNVAGAVQDANAARAVSDATDSDASADAPELDGLVGDVESWLEGEEVLVEHITAEEGSHDGTGGVALHVDNEAMPDKEYEWFKSVIGDNVDDPEWHLGFADDGCPNCGAEDDDFYVLVPAAAVPELVG